MSETTIAPAKANAWRNQEPFTVSQETYDAFKRIKKDFWCKLCGKKLTPGSAARWIYANGTPGMGTGNFFVCAECDGPDVLARGKASLELAVKLAEQWGIYGPDWQSACTGFK